MCLSGVKFYVEMKAKKKDSNNSWLNKEHEKGACLGGALLCGSGN